MLFPTTDFAIFFALVFTATWLLNPYPRMEALHDRRQVLLLQLVGLALRVPPRGIDHDRVCRRELHRQVRGERQETALVVSLAGLLGLLGWFKYYTFLAVNIDNLTQHLFGHGPLPLKQVLLPVGISFFTFMAISYVVDVYRNEPRPARRPRGLPVVLPAPRRRPDRAGRGMLRQIRHKRDPKHIDFGRASWLIAVGLFKKMVISSYISSAIVDGLRFSSHALERRYWIRHLFVKLIPHNQISVCSNDNVAQHAIPEDIPLQNRV